MTKQSRKLPEQLAKLSPYEKIALVEDLLASVPNDNDLVWNEFWGLEAASRIAAYERGEMGAESAEDVLAWLKAQYSES